MKTVKVIKKVKAIEKVISVIGIISLFLGLFDIINGDITILIVLLFSGVIGILDGYCSYINNKKRESIFLFLGGIFIIFASAITAFFL